MPRRYYAPGAKKDWDVRARARLRLFSRTLRHIIQATPHVMAHPVKAYRERRRLSLSSKQLEKAWRGDSDPIRVKNKRKEKDVRHLDGIGYTPRHITLRQYFTALQNGPTHPVPVIEPRVRETSSTYTGWTKRITHPQGEPDKIVLKKYDPDGTLREVVTLDFKRKISEIRNIATGKRIRGKLTEQSIRDI